MLIPGMLLAALGPSSDTGAAAGCPRLSGRLQLSLAPGEPSHCHQQPPQTSSMDQGALGASCQGKREGEPLGKRSELLERGLGDLHINMQSQGERQSLCTIPSSPLPTGHYCLLSITHRLSVCLTQGENKTKMLHSCSQCVHGRAKPTADIKALVSSNNRIAITATCTRNAATSCAKQPGHHFRSACSSVLAPTRHSNVMRYVHSFNFFNTEHLVQGCVTIWWPRFCTVV